jgi:rhodanese-related sulfurtransferase
MRDCLAAVVVALALVSGCLSQAGTALQSSAIGVSVEDAKGLIDAGDGSLVVLDVRTPGEYLEGHIRGAVNVDYSGKDFRGRLAELDKGKRYLVYCRTGHRSAEAARIMGESGFNKTYDMSGGITEWNAKGYPTSV